jgi:hypothetical protein
VNHLVVLRLDFANRDTPPLRRDGFQHMPHCRAAFAHRLDKMAHAARAVGVLVAVFLLVARRLHDLYARPVGLELVGDYHRQAGARAGAHLGAVRDDRHKTARIDRDEYTRVADDAARHLGGTGGVGGEDGAGRDEFGGDDEPAGGEQSLQEAAAAHILDGGMDGCHVTLLWRPP